MVTERVKYSFKNAKTSVGFFLLMLFVNFFSRRIFLEYLGDNVSGLTTLMQYTIGLLNMADLGIATAISFALFKPIFDGDKQQINEIISLFSYLFKIVGAVVVIIGVVIAFFITSLAGDSVPSIYVYASYFTFLFTSSLSYFVNYKQYLLISNQRTYVVTSLLNSVNITRMIVQMGLVALAGMGYLTFLTLEVAFAVIYAVILERRVKREYPWLNPSAKLGREVMGRYKHVFKSIKQVVSHKFAGVVLAQSDSIIISSMISLTSVTFYQNYSMLVGRVVVLVVSIFSGSPAGIGNLISEGNTEKTKEVFHQYNVMLHIVGGVFAFCVYHLTSPFMLLWLGEGRYVLSNLIVAVITINMYISIVKMPLYMFLNGYGIYKDTWAPWIEATANLLISIIGAYYFGLIGVVVGTAISTGAISFGWKPLLLFRDGLKDSVWNYYRTTFVYIIVYAIIFCISSWVISFTGGVVSGSFVSFICYSGLLFAAFSILYIAVILAISGHARKIATLVVNMLLRRVK